MQINTVSLIHRTPASVVEFRSRKELNHFLQTHPQATTAIDTAPEQPTTIVLSHIPLNEIHDASMESEILSFLSPDLVLSGHTHHCNSTVHSYHPREDGVSRRSVMEATVPTCSYRMGERHMGVGVVTVGELVCVCVTYVSWIHVLSPIHR